MAPIQTFSLQVSTGDDDSSKRAVLPSCNHVSSCTAPYLTWDPQLAHEKERDGMDVHGFISEEVDLSEKTLRMEALHNCNYDVQQAWTLVVSYYQSQTNICKDFRNAAVTMMFVREFSSEYFAKTNDMKYIARRLNCTTEVAWIQFYRWKASKRPMPEIADCPKERDIYDKENCDPSLVKNAVIASTGRTTTALTTHPNFYDNEMDAKLAISAKPAPAMSTSNTAKDDTQGVLTCLHMNPTLRPGRFLNSFHR
jgi:hypothetical protein